MKGFRSRIVLLVLLSAGLLAPTSPNRAEEKAPPESPVPQTFDLSISPVAPPTPLLKYELLPSFRQRKPGNRAPYYLRAMIHWDHSLSEDVRDQFVKVLRANDGRAESFSPDAVRELLPAFDFILRELESATVRDNCDWNLDLQYLEGWDAISFSLEEFQGMREFARLLMLKGRLEVAEGRFDDALKTIQIGHQLARDVAEPPTMINSLIGIAFTTIMNTVLIDWVAQPDAPNLYWALATRPRPFIDMRNAFQFEAGLPVRMFPVLQNPETSERSDEQWNRLVRELVLDLENIDKYWKEGQQAPDEEDLSRADQVIDEALPIARRELLSAGFDPAQLDNMPDGQLLSIHSSRYVREQFDGLVAVLHAPPPDARRLISEFESRFAATRASAESATRRESLPVVVWMLPALRPAWTAWHRTSQRLDGLQCIEAIRAYAATHDGQFPASLDEIIDTPCPLNLQTGQPFPYRVENGQAVFTIPFDQLNLPPREYTLQIR